MGYRIKLLGLFLWVLLHLASFSFILVNTQDVREEGATVKGSVVINGRSVIGNIDDDFVCATLDWWPPEKCDYGRCSWGLASLLNLVLLLFSLSKKWFLNL